jgi:hypothetical protein
VGTVDRCFESFAGDESVDLSAVVGDFFVERATDSGRGDVLPAGRFLFSGMRFKIIHQMQGVINLINQYPSLSR